MKSLLRILLGILCILVAFACARAISDNSPRPDLRIGLLVVENHAWESATATLLCNGSPRERIHQIPTGKTATRKVNLFGCSEARVHVRLFPSGRQWMSDPVYPQPHHELEVEVHDKLRPTVVAN